MAAGGKAGLREGPSLVLWGGEQRPLTCPGTGGPEREKLTVRARKVTRGGVGSGGWSSPGSGAHGRRGAQGTRPQWEQEAGQSPGAGSFARSAAGKRGGLLPSVLLFSLRGESKRVGTWVAGRRGVSGCSEGELTHNGEAESEAPGLP